MDWVFEAQGWIAFLTLAALELRSAYVEGDRV